MKYPVRFVTTMDNAVIQLQNGPALARYSTPAGYFEMH